MKVICIDDSLAPLKGMSIYRTDFYVKFGKIYNVTAEYPDREYGTVYDLAEDPYGGKWDAKRFAQLSEIDETEMERNYNKELV